MSLHTTAWMRTLARSACVLALPLGLLLSSNAHAVPSYSRQTGQECAACHIGAYGPQLTPYGMRFKIGGYTDSDGNGKHVPVSGMAVGSISHTATEGDDGKVNHDDLAEASVFLAGKIAPHVGSFTQLTYDGVAHHTSLDRLDLRATTTTSVYGKDTVFGVSVNNAPTLSDPFNTLSAWGFPYTEAARGAGPGGAELKGIGGLEGNTLGTTGYMFWNDHLYAELGIYRSFSLSALDRMGLGGDTPDRVKGSNYWRLAWLGDQHKKAWSVGVFGNRAGLENRTSGITTGRVQDLGIDGSYQFLGTREHIGTVNAAYIREHDDYTGDTTKETKLNASYYFHNTWGASAGLFDARSTGNVNANRGYILQADWTPWGKEDSWKAPWANLRVGVQYVGFSRAYDDTGAKEKASDNNSLNFFVWTAF